jgi:hypothetical protein
MGHMNFHDQMVELARRQDNGGSLTTVDGTVYSIAYVTATPTFTGVIGGYTTLTDDSSPTPDAQQPSSSSESAPASSETQPATSSSISSVQTTASPTPLAAPTSQVATTSEGILGNTNTGSSSVAVASGAASSDTSSSSSSGLSTGAKAGLAIAIIAVVGLVAVFLLWLLGKKRRQLEAQQKASDNEKRAPGPLSNGTEMATRSPPISATAPRISLRPVSRMLPEFMGAGKSRLSAGNMLNTIGESDTTSSRKTPSPQPRGPSPVQARGLGLAAATQSSHDSNPNNPFADPQNPFADPEKAAVQAPAPLAIAPPAVRQEPVAPAPVAIKPISASVSAPIQVPAPVVAPAASPIVAPIVAPAQPVQPIQPAQPSPASSAPSSPALVAGAAGPGSEAPQGNVYRVLMDFAPSMEDELELKTGQLVRLLHEYDDGWVSR